MSPRTGRLRTSESRSLLECPVSRDGLGAFGLPPWRRVPSAETRGRPRDQDVNRRGLCKEATAFAKRARDGSGRSRMEPGPPLATEAGLFFKAPTRAPPSACPATAAAAEG